MTLSDIEQRCSWMSDDIRERTVAWARHCLQHIGDQWALRTWGPRAIGELAALVDVGPVTVRELFMLQLQFKMWSEYPDTLKAIYNTCGGCPQAPLPAHGLISKPRWWS